MKKLVIASLLTIAVATPALAGETFYVAQNTKNQKCRVVTEEPSGKLTMLGAPYQKRGEAVKAMKAMDACKAPATDSSKS
ncbi:hypothetical protein V6C03_05600 [Methyloligella sp. 2.7D]|uniref:hypothetical protein n=1 Tax=unclassified Methyloligella TaxID=2625955 RepID=UPI00157D7CAC|nr:hypothetical protein [Methyloligella sp. GL2]QKP78601.1 hypothetical protein HT051_14850 [Methyloligella sp. GL2]